MLSLSFYAGFMLFFTGFLFGKVTPKLLHRPPVLPGQTWDVPGRGKITVGGTYVGVFLIKYVVLPGVADVYWPTLGEWHRSGAKLANNHDAVSEFDA